ncbi:MAG: hypothetical protein GX046_06300 [Tissierellia bacterium]|nr:hypothetical protein [Tissierellia bacterium]
MKLTRSPKKENATVVGILSDKLLLNKMLEAQDKIKVPQLLSYNFRSVFYYNQNATIIHSPQHLIDYLTHIMKNEGLDSLFIKFSGGKQGKHCYLFNLNPLKIENIVNNFDFIRSNNFIIQKTIVQHEGINSIYKDSINTLRIDVSHLNGKITPLSALMRFGINGSNIDNVSSGGFFVPINIETGKFRAKGFSFLEYGGATYYEHPNTKFKFKDQEIPFFEEALEMAMEASNQLPDLLVGWDIAIGPSGPILVEGNHNYSIKMSEMSYGGYKKHPVFMEMFQELGIK